MTKLHSSLAVPLLVAAALLCMTSNAQLQSPFNVVTGPFPFCPPCMKNISATQYDVQIIPRPPTVDPGYFCWQLVVKSPCPVPNSPCCQFNISKVEFWINEQCSVTGWKAIKGPATGPFNFTRNDPQQALFNPNNNATTGSNVLRIQGIDIPASEANGQIFCIKPSASNLCQTLQDLCFRPTPEWDPARCIISLFDPYRQDDNTPDRHDCCPVVDDVPDTPGDALPPPPPLCEPEPWNKCKCNSSATATPFRFQDKVVQKPGLANPTNNMTCFQSSFLEIPSVYGERCPRARYVNKIEFQANVTKRSSVIGAYYKTTTSSYIDVTSNIAWRDPNTGPNVLKIADLAILRADWQAGVEVCLEFSTGVKLQDICLPAVNGVTCPQVQCLYAIFEENRFCCPWGYVGY